MEVLSKSPSETKELAYRVALGLEGGDILALYGNLGAGKTTFVQGLVEVLSEGEKASSPTFIVIRHYKTREAGKIRRINHVDLYRIGEVDEALNIGLLDMLKEPDSLTIIEWPEIFESKLPATTIKIRFEALDGEERRITCSKSF